MTSSVRSAAAEAPLSERGLVRIAMLAVAAPVVCALAGLLVLTVLHRVQAGFVARYAALHFAALPGTDVAPDGTHGPASFLFGLRGGQVVVARNPALWAMEIGMTSFALVPFLLIAGAGAIYGLATRRRSVVFAAVPPIVALLWFWFGTLRLLCGGYELGFDPATDIFAVNGHAVATLSGVAAFEGRVTRNLKGRVSWALLARLADGRAVDVSGPGVDANVVGAAAPLNVLLVQMRAGEPAACETCVLSPDALEGLRARIVGVFGGRPQ